MKRFVVGAAALVAAGWTASAEAADLSYGQRAPYTVNQPLNAYSWAGPYLGGNIGFAFAAHAEPDGYTILLATNAYSVNLGLYKSLPFDPYKDFVGISELATSPNTFVVRSELPAKTIKEFIALARKDPEKYNCATPPIGTTREF
mgnify:CR=1 FL=1